MAILKGQHKFMKLSNIGHFYCISTYLKLTKNIVTLYFIHTDKYTLISIHYATNETMHQ